MYYELKQEVYDGLKKICMDVWAAGESMSVNAMLMKLMDMKDLPMHCPYHHFIVPAAMLTQTALKEKRSEDQLAQWLDVAEERGKTVPAGFCGECGTCGSAVGAGTFLSIYTGTTPKSVENWQHVNELTARCLLDIAAYPGPRCCKRTSFLAVNAALPYINEKYQLGLEEDKEIVCHYHDYNPDCLHEKCPFYG